MRPVNTYRRCTTRSSGWRAAALALGVAILLTGGSVHTHAGERAERRLTGYESSPLYREWVAWKKAHPHSAYHQVPDPPGAATVREVSLLVMNVERLPSFTVRFFADGRVEYLGHQNAVSPGRRTGRLDRWHFLSLAELVQELRFSELESAYFAWYDATTYLFAVEWSDGTRKLVMDQPQVGPRVLWALEMTMERLLDEVEWDQATPPTPTPAREAPARAGG